MKTGTFGEQLASAIREYLVANGLVRKDGAPSLGRINGRILAELADRFHEKWVAAQEPAKPRRTPGAGTKIPPTEDEVRAYCREKGYTFSPGKFVGYYESNGWKVGRNPMKNWHSACVTFQGDAPLRPPEPVARGGYGGIPEPAGWRAYAATLMDPSVADRWGALDHATRIHMLKQMRASVPSGPIDARDAREEIAEKMQNFLAQSDEATNMEDDT